MASTAAAPAADATAEDSVVDRNPLLEGSYRASKKQAFGKHFVLFSEAVPETSGDVMTETRSQRIYFRDQKSQPWKVLASFTDTDPCAEAEARTLLAFLQKHDIEETDTIEHYKIDDVLVVCSEMEMADADEDDDEDDDDADDVDADAEADESGVREETSPTSETSKISSMREDDESVDDADVFVSYRIYRRHAKGPDDAKGRKHPWIELIASGEGRRSDAMEEASIVHERE